jgi:lipopolysaccharide transport system permease protein
MLTVDSRGWRALPTHVAHLVERRELLFNLAARDLKVRYKQSMLGIAWAIVQPFSLMVVFSLIIPSFGQIKTGGVPYPIFSYVALVPWTYFANGLSSGAGSLVANAGLVAKIYFPREIFPLASLMASFVDFLAAAAIFAGMLLFYRIPPSPALLWLPVLVLLQMALMFGLMLVLSAANVFYRDVRFLLPFALQLWLFVTPVIYPLAQIPSRYRTLIAINPMTGIIDSYRRVILQGQSPSSILLSFTAMAALLLLAGGYAFFKTDEPQFADVI